MAKTTFPAGSNPNAALMRATVIAWSWARGAVIAAAVAAGALTLLMLGQGSLAVGLPIAAAAAGFALFAFRKARAAFALIDETPFGESQSATTAAPRDADWASKYLVY